MIILLHVQGYDPYAKGGEPYMLHDRVNQGACDNYTFSGKLE